MFKSHHASIFFWCVTLAFEDGIRTNFISQRCSIRRLSWATLISYWLWLTDGRPIHPGINGALTRAQKQKDHSDTLESFTNDIIKSGGGRSTPELVDVLVQKSAEVSERIQASLAFVSLGLLRAPA